MIHVAVIGFGYWGKNLVRNFHKSEQCEVVYVIDLDTQKCDDCQRQYTSIVTDTSITSALLDTSIDAIIIATPISTHYELTKMALLADKHVLCEKPLSQSTAEVKELMALAEQRQKVLMVDYTFLYTGAIQKLKDLLDRNALGKLLYWDSVRINLGIFQSDANVVADLSTHDLSILIYLLDAVPISVKAEGISHTPNGIINLAYITLYYEDDFMVHLHCSWTSPVKIRQILVGGDQKMVVYNDMEPTEKIKVYEAQMPPIHQDESLRTQTLTDYRVGDIYIPKLHTEEALTGMVRDFLSNIVDPHHQGKVNPKLIYKVVRVLEAIQKALSTGEIIHL